MLLGPWCPGGCWAWGRGGEARPGIGSKHWGVWTSDEAYTGRTSNRTTHTLKKLGFCVRRWKWVYANVKGDVPKSQRWGPRVWVEWSRSDQKTGVAGLSRDSWVSRQKNENIQGMGLFCVCLYWSTNIQTGILPVSLIILGFLGVSDSKESACKAEDLGSIPGSGRSPGARPGNPRQCSCLAGHSPWVHKGSDTSERLSTHHNFILVFWTRPWTPKALCKYLFNKCWIMNVAVYDIKENRHLMQFLLSVSQRGLLWILSVG